MSILLEFAALAAGIVAGVAIIPLLVITGVLKSGMVGKLMFYLGQRAAGASAVRKRGHHYSIEMMDEEDGELYLDGEQIDRDDCYLFGRRPLAIISDKSEKGDEWFKTADDIDPPRQGYREYMPWSAADEPLIDLSTVADKLQGTNGNDIIITAIQKALREQGGEQNIGQIVAMVGSVISLIAGMIIGLMIL